MRILLPGGSGQIGTILARHLHAGGHHVTVLSRTPKPAAWATAKWDGETLAPSWTDLLETTDAVIHLSGKSVNCRYTPQNRKLILDSRVVPTTLLGHAIAACKTPPKVWMNASTSTFYRDTTGSHDRPNDEFTGEPGGQEANVPDTWRFSISVAKAWEAAFYATPLPATRRIALRTSMTMSPDPGGVFRVLLRLARLGLGGTLGTGRQYVSWVHEADYCAITDFLLAHPEISGPVNITSPNPLPNRDFQRDLRKAAGVPIGLPAFNWMLEIGTFLMRTETELVLKSRRAIPTVVQNHGYQFLYPTWPEAAQNLVGRTNQRGSPASLSSIE